MKWNEITEAKQLPGTYAGVRFDSSTIDALVEYTKTNEIPEPVKPADFHTTLLYSRKHLPNYQPISSYDELMQGTVTGVDLWPAQSDGVKRTLVLTFKCPQLSKRHKELMDEHKAQWDFPNFKPHVTLSYQAAGFDLASLPKFKHPLRIVGEYVEELDD